MICTTCLPLLVQLALGTLIKLLILSSVSWNISCTANIGSVTWNQDPVHPGVLGDKRSGSTFVLKNPSIMYSFFRRGWWLAVGGWRMAVI
jgi:hypothetical protein